MKRALKYFLFVFIGLVLILGGLVALVTWALNTPEGTRLLLRTISALSPLAIDAQDISGRMRDELQIRGLRIRWPQGELHADSFRLRWQATELWNRRITVQEISLDGVQLKDDRPETGKISFRGWPETPFWLSRVQGRIDSLRIQGMVYQRLQESPLPIDVLFSRLQWDGEVLAVKDFALKSPSSQAEGDMNFGFSPPSLSLNLQATFPKEYAGLDSLSAKIYLEPAESREKAKGAFQVSGWRKSQESLLFGGDLGLTRTSLALQNLRLLQPERRGKIQGEGEIAFSERPKIWLKAEVSGLDLSPELGVVTDLSGKAEIRGSLDGYKGQFQFVNRSNGWQKVQTTAAFRGNLQNLEISTLDARWLNGSVKGPLKISWKEEISVRGKLQGRKLDPAVLSPEWKGEVNLNLEGEFVSPPAKPRKASFKAGLLESRFFGRVLTGNLEGNWQENLLNITQLGLSGRGFDLHGKGVLQERLSLTGRFTDLSVFIPESQGAISATGWLCYRENRLSGMLTAEGKDSLIQGVKAGSFQAELHLKEYGENGIPVFSLEARAGNLTAGPLDIPSLNFNLSGSPAAHRAQFAMALKGVEIQGEFTGAYQGSLWRGSIEKLNGRDARGAWNLQAPARINLSANQFQLSPLAIKSGQEERLKVQANLTLNPVQGSLQAQWQNIDLARANPWIAPADLSGQSSGTLTAQRQESAWQISGSGKFKGAFAREHLRLEVASGEAKLDWNGRGLLASAALKINSGGGFEAQISSAESFQLALPKAGKFEAQWRALDLGLLNPLLPRDLALEGKNSGQFSGGWSDGSSLEAAGKVTVSHGQLTWKGGPKPISINQGSAYADFAWRGERIQGNLTITSSEQGTLKGSFLLPLSASFSPSFHPQGPIHLSFQGQVQEKGLLGNVYPQRISKSRGRLDIDLNADGTWEKPRWKGSLEISDAGLQIVSSKNAQKNGKGLPPLIWEMPSASAVLDWGPRGLSVNLNMALKEKGKIEGTLISSEPARMALPQRGKVDLRWTELDLVALQPLLPDGFFLEGRAEGKFNGAWLPQFRLNVTGGLRVAQGILGWQEQKGRISAGIHQAALDFHWREDRLQGKVAFSLREYGSVQGDFHLPLAARPPFRLDPGGPVQVALRGQAQEKGLLSAFFPGMVEETRGNIDLDLKADGTWGKPNLQGSLHLTDAGAYLPSLGIRVEGLSSRWKLLNEQVQVESFQARSGPGQIEGTGMIWLKHGEIDRFEGKLKGERFQTFYLPHLRVQSSPRLQFQGTPQKISVRGEIVLPEVRIYEVSGPGVVQASSDLVMIDKAPEGTPPFTLDIQVRITLGDRIEVKAGGIDARLAGRLDLNILGWKPEGITARGEVRLTQGLYSGYGLNLRVERGRFIYSGGMVDNPALDILALRRADDLERLYNIRVGVAVFGTLKNPNVKLYSQPARKDEEILSYLLLGRPYDPKEGNLSLLLMGAGGLLAGDSISTLDQLKTKLGIDTVDIQTGGGDLPRSMLTIGKYLTPQLYVSYGYSVFGEEQLLKVRYRISKSWEVESWRGNAMGVDLYYRIDFY